MNKRLADLCRVAVQHGFDTFPFSSNGMLLTPDRLDDLPKANYIFRIDFCANEVFFEKHRGTRGSWDQVRRNIVNIVNNYDNMTVVIFDISAFGESGQDISANIEQTRRLFDRKVMVYPLRFHNAGGFLDNQIHESRRKYNLCPYPWTSLVIACNGDVVSCCRDLRRRTVLGNLFDSELADIWNGELFQDLRQKLINQDTDAIDACADCDLPYDSAKFSIRNLVRVARQRLRLF